MLTQDNLVALRNNVEDAQGRIRSAMRKLVGGAGQAALADLEIAEAELRRVSADVARACANGRAPEPRD